MGKFDKSILIKLVIVTIVSAGILTAFSIPLGPIPVLGDLLFPGSDIWGFPGDVAKEETIKVEGMTAPVTIYRDEWGIPHIYATTESDAVFAMGYLHAQDRLFMMDMARRLTRGRLSEVMGPDMIDVDKYNLNMLKDYWTVKTVEMVKLQAETDQDVEEIYNQLCSYRDGVNYYIQSTSVYPIEYTLLGFEPTPWTLEDTFSMQKYMAEDLTWGYGDLNAYLCNAAMGIENYSQFSSHPQPFQVPIVPDYGDFPDTPSSASNPTTSSALSELITDLLTVVNEFPQVKQRSGAEDLIGSNNWVVNGSKTATGYPLLCNDMHLGWNLPGIWYQGHIVVDSDNDELDLNLWGFFLPGVPYPLVGHNQYVGWGFTNTGYDVLDWYFYDGYNATHYWYKGELIPYEYIDYSIPVKGAAAEQFEIKTTVHGPIFTDLIGSRFPNENYANYQIACKWIGHYASEEMKAFYGYAHAKNRIDYNNAAEFFWAPAQNQVYADISGHIGIRPTGKVPIRDDSGIPEDHMGNGTMPYNGSAGQGEWVEWLPFDDLPHSENPAQEYLVSANQIVAGPDFLNEYSTQSTYSDGYRARRINQLLAAKDDLTIEDMKDVQLDVYSVFAASVIPDLIEVLSNLVSKTSLQTAAYDALEGWDFEMVTTSAGPSIYRAWQEAYRREILADDLKVWNLPISGLSMMSMAIVENLTLNDPQSHWFDNISTPEIEDRNDTMIAALNRALDGLSEFFGTTNVSQWLWGKLHFVYYESLTGLSALSAGPFPVDGYGSTVNPSGGVLWNGDKIQPIIATGGPSERMIIDFSDFAHDLSIIPSGQRAIPSSKHYTDQLMMFLKGEYHTNHFEASTSSLFLDDWIESTLTILPGGE